ncbi:hypothetical protein [Rhizobium jaguaris]|uniref:Uncharacterized protein n=1 Tax=Rhizobium jaguaris TaxID=1312183 RepID=A0A387FR09_9HYPH|nr:hypothetical protein [Rhizobium jaguaris]AYG57692.1 hypothetical protein CCGE525_01805 [Rhizobium jaguaris]
MIRFAPQAAQIATPLKAIKESPAVEPAKVTDERNELTANGMLLAELPEVPVRSKTTSSDQSTKARSPRKPKAKPEAAAAMQLDLNT